jgi:hypothetical protein
VSEEERMKKIIVTMTLAAVSLLACEETEGEGFRRGNRNPGDDGAEQDAAQDPNEPGGCALGAKHVGFAGEDFAASRTAGGIGKDRRRIKPFSALKSEIERVLGTSPATLSQSAAAFGDVPVRWYAEPVAGAVSLYTTASLVFTACYDAMSAPTYTQAPTAATAATECAALQRKAWQRTPTPDETKACVDLAVTASASEPSPRRRWAQACASVMTSAGFISY